MSSSHTHGTRTERPERIELAAVTGAASALPAGELIRGA